MNEIVSSEWLLENINEAKIIILDASFKKIVGSSNETLENKSIPNSRFFDLKNSFSDLENPFPNTIPTPEQFEIECRKLGINNDSKIIVYDNKGVYSSPRAWWLFKTMGHANVQVLNGGLPDWIRKEFPTVERKKEVFTQGNFTADFQGNFVKSYMDILENTKKKSFTVVDARSNGRFEGTEKEPREWLQSGHIPHSINIPYQEVLENGRFKSKENLEALFTQKLEDTDELVFSCGSGLTACIVMLAKEISQGSNKLVYDGSWTEWAESQNLKAD